MVIYVTSEEDGEEKQKLQICTTDDPGSKTCWVPVSDRFSMLSTTEIVFFICCPFYRSHF